MTTILLPKDISSIQEPEALPEDYYKLRIVEEPTIIPNKKKELGGVNAPGAGDNLFMRLRVISENPEFNGRSFRKWIPLPNEADKLDFTTMGQSKEDFKMSMLAKISAGFSGIEPEGNEINLQAGQEAWVYVTQGLDQTGTRFMNEVDFMSQIKPV